MSVEENKAILRRFYDEVFNKRNLALADEMIGSEFINHAAPPDTPVVATSRIRGIIKA